MQIKKKNIEGAKFLSTLAFTVPMGQQEQNFALGHF